MGLFSEHCFCRSRPCSSRRAALQMPETFAYTMAFAMLYYGDRWLAESRERDFWLAAAFGALMPLAKLPLLVFGLPMAYLAWSRRGKRALGSPRLYLLAAIVLIPKRHLRLLHVAPDAYIGRFLHHPSTWGTLRSVESEVLVRGPLAYRALWNRPGPGP